MVQQQGTDLGIARSFRRLFGRRVVIDNVAKDFFQVVPAHVGGPFLHHPDHGCRQCFMRQHVDTGRCALHGSRFARGAAEHHAAALVADAVPHRRMHRRRVDGKRDDFQVGVLEQHHPPVGTGDEGLGEAAEAAGGHRRVAVAGHPVARRCA